MVHYVHADRRKEAQQQRLINLAEAQRSEGRAQGRGLVLRLAARTAIVITLAIVLNFA
jgi:hypothetical protein